jgi:hypothetical protein
MATVQVNGSSLTGNGFGSFLEAKNSNGTMKANGLVDSSVIDKVTTITPVVDVFASVVVEDTVTVRDYAGKAVSDGVFSYDNSRPISSLLTSELAGIANTAIKSPSNNGDNIRSINKLEVLRTVKLTTAVRENKYNRVTNQYDIGFPEVQVDVLEQDNAANPTGPVPGQLTYMDGSLVPVNDAYASKTNY